jgi:hypothetical protein
VSGLRVWLCDAPARPKPVKPQVKVIFTPPFTHLDDHGIRPAK